MRRKSRKELRWFLYLIGFQLTSRLGWVCLCCLLVSFRSSHVMNILLLLMFEWYQFLKLHPEIVPFSLFTFPTYLPAHIKLTVNSIQYLTVIPWVCIRYVRCCIANKVYSVELAIIISYPTTPPPSLPIKTPLLYEAYHICRVWYNTSFTRMVLDDRLVFTWVLKVICVTLVLRQYGTRLA